MIVTTFLSPDSSSGMFTYAVDYASEEILLNVYEFSSPSITDSLIAARGQESKCVSACRGRTGRGDQPVRKIYDLEDVRRWNTRPRNGL
ncbi:MAG: hypothetical protein WCF90_11295 [Methanomicrobiales archaeon]